MITFPASNAGTIQELPIDMLVAYSKHPFTLYSGERLDDMVQSIKNNGVLMPIIVREMDGKYEILAGHNRVNAAKLVGFTSIPAVIKTNLSDELAEMYVIETNLIQRGFKDLKISEQAAVVALRHSKMFDDKKAAAIREELNDIQLGIAEPKESKLARVGEEYGLSKNTIARLIRINKLLTACADYTIAIDTSTLSIRAAVELSYIQSKEALYAIFKHYQTSILIDNSWQESVKIDLKLAERLREAFENFDGDEENAKMRIVTMWHEDKEKTPKEKIFRVKTEVYNRFFKIGDTEDYVNDTIEKALEQYFSN